VSKPQRYLSLDRVVWRSVDEKLYTGLVLDVARGPTIRGAVGGERSALRAEEATPALRRKSPTIPASFAANFNNGRDDRGVDGRPQGVSGPPSNEWMPDGNPGTRREISNRRRMCESEKGTSYKNPT
jgi:hypothetical protein